MTATTTYTHPADACHHTQVRYFQAWSEPIQPGDLEGAEGEDGEEDDDGEWGPLGDTLSTTATGTTATTATGNTRGASLSVPPRFGMCARHL